MLVGSKEKRQVIREREALSGRIAQNGAENFLTRPDLIVNHQEAWDLFVQFPSSLEAKPPLESQPPAGSFFDVRFGIGRHEHELTRPSIRVLKKRADSRLTWTLNQTDSGLPLSELALTELDSGEVAGAEYNGPPFADRLFVDTAPDVRTDVQEGRRSTVARGDSTRLRAVATKKVET